MLFSLFFAKQMAPLILCNLACWISLKFSFIQSVPTIMNATKKNQSNQLNRFGFYPERKKIDIISLHVLAINNVKSIKL